MTTNRRPLQKRKQRARQNDEPIVTYSRLEAEATAAAPHDFDANEPATPLYEAVEVPRATRPPPRDSFAAEPELRARRDFDDDVDPLEPEPRRGRLRLLLVAGLGAIGLAAGIGVLMATLGPSGPVTATTEPLNPPALSEPGEATDDVARTLPNVREIPLAPGSNAGGGAGSGAVATDRLVPAEPVAAVEPPAPRPRPDKPATETAATDPGQPAVAVPIDTPVATTAPAAAPSPAGEDDFLRRIEQTLNRIDEPAATAAPVVVSPAPVAAPAPVATPAPATTTTLQPVFPADTSVDLLPADDVIIDEAGIVADEDLMMDGGGHFDFEQSGTPVLDAPATVTTIEPLPTPPATFDAGAPLAPPNDILLEQAPATAAPPAKATRLQRLFPRLLPAAEAPVAPVAPAAPVVQPAPLNLN